MNDAVFIRPSVRLAFSRDLLDTMVGLSPEAFRAVAAAKSFAEDALAEFLVASAAHEAIVVAHDDVILVIQFHAKGERYFIAGLIVCEPDPPPTPPAGIGRAPISTLARELLNVIGLRHARNLTDNADDAFDWYQIDVVRDVAADCPFLRSIGTVDAGRTSLSAIIGLFAAPPLRRLMSAAAASTGQRHPHGPGRSCTTDGAPLILPTLRAPTVLLPTHAPDLPPYGFTAMLKIFDRIAVSTESCLPGQQPPFTSGSNWHENLVDSPQNTDAGDGATGRVHDAGARFADGFLASTSTEE